MTVSISATTAFSHDERINGLKVFYLADTIDADSRAFHFYVRIENDIVYDVRDERLAPITQVAGFRIYQAIR